jgi:transcriptional regulator with XRE-family HTH domain
LKDIIQISFGHALRKYRLQQKLSQEKLAELANLDRTYISQIERGLKSPSIKTLFALAQALQIDASLLIVELENDLKHSKAQ